MNRYNKLKIRTLKVFAFAPGAWFTPSGVADRLAFVPRRAAQTFLKRLRRLGLLYSQDFSSATTRYNISEKGRARLHWLESRMR